MTRIGPSSSFPLSRLRLPLERISRCVARKLCKKIVYRYVKMRLIIGILISSMCDAIVFHSIVCLAVREKSLFCTIRFHFSICFSTCRTQYAAFSTSRITAIFGSHIISSTRTFYRRDVCLSALTRKTLKVSRFNWKITIIRLSWFIRVYRRANNFEKYTSSNGLDD